MVSMVNLKNDFKKFSNLNYFLGYSEKLIEPKRAFDLIRSDVCELLEKSNEGWKKQGPNDSVSSLSQFRVLGGGYDGGTVELMETACLKHGLIGLSALIQTLNSQDFVDKISSHLGCGKLVLLNSRDKVSLWQLLTTTPIYLNLKLSAYPSNSGMELHRDNRRKLVGMLLYFGFSDNKKRNYGGTQFYSDLRAPEGWSKSATDHLFAESELLELIHDHAPTPNSFVIFSINENSWHGIKKMPADLDPNVERINLQINFRRPQKFTFVAKCCRVILHNLNKMLKPDS